MGFFSRDCLCCKHPLLSAGAVNARNSWMQKGRVVHENGTVIQGVYDGYGRLDGRDAWDYDDKASVWHAACWEADGKPEGYRGNSRGSADQGWFFDEGDHDMDEPGAPRAPARKRSIGRGR